MPHIARLVMAAGHAGLQLLFGTTGDCFDNAAMETFWATLKWEIAHIRCPRGFWSLAAS
jgi:hypothetical protein